MGPSPDVGWRCRDRLFPLHRLQLTKTSSKNKMPELFQGLPNHCRENPGLPENWGAGNRLVQIALLKIGISVTG
jgi:hypothetical protein